VDFYCARARLIVEVDGPIHDARQEEDAIRDAFLKNRGFRVLRFTNDEVNGNMDCVLQRIKEALTVANETN
jgi:very-short-patch-repair endonuclease